MARAASGGWWTRGALAVLLGCLFLVLAGHAAAGTSSLSGDANCDGKVNAIDAALILQFDVGLLSSLRCQDNAETNRDGRINAIDALRVLQVVAGFMDTLEPPVITVGSLPLMVGQQGFVDVGVRNIIRPGLCCWAIDLRYDPDVLSVVECQARFTGMGAVVCDPDFEADAVRVSGATPVGLFGDLVLATIAFHCTAAGTSPLTLDVGVLADATVGNPQAIDAEVRNGTITCT